MKAEREAAAKAYLDATILGTPEERAEDLAERFRDREKAAMERLLREVAEYVGALDSTLAAELRNPGTFDLDEWLDSDEP